MDMAHGGYDIRSASEMDSLVASRWPLMISADVQLQLLARPYQLARMTFSAYRGDDTSASDMHDDPYGRGRFGAVPASEAEIRRLPKATTDVVKEKDCAVCLESFEEGEELRKMACPSSHGFHDGCILKWLRVSRLCPLCRFALPAE